MLMAFASRLHFCETGKRVGVNNGVMLGNRIHKQSSYLQHIHVLVGDVALLLQLVQRQEFFDLAQPEQFHLLAFVVEEHLEFGTSLPGTAKTTTSSALVEAYKGRMFMCV